MREVFIAEVVGMETVVGRAEKLVAVGVVIICVAFKGGVME